MRSFIAAAGTRPQDPIGEDDGDPEETDGDRAADEIGPASDQHGPAELDLEDRADDQAQAQDQGGSGEVESLEDEAYQAERGIPGTPYSIFEIIRGTICPCRKWSGRWLWVSPIMGPGRATEDSRPFSAKTTTRPIFEPQRIESGQS